MKLLILFLFISWPVQAQEAVDPACQALERHKTINDATYRAGVDVNGNAVVPADLGTTASSIVKNVTRIPLTVDLTERSRALGSPVQEGLELDANFGVLEIYEDGRVLLDGQDWTNNLQTLCGKSHKVITKDKMMKKEEALPFKEIVPVVATPPKEPVVRTHKIRTQEVEILDFPAPEYKVLMETPPPMADKNEISDVKTKIITDKPELIPDEILQGGFYRE